MKLWPTKKLGEIATVESGGTPRRSNPTYFRGKIPFVKIEDMLKDPITETGEKITKEGLENSAAKIWGKGTILFSIFATLGRVSKLGIDAAANQAIAGIFNIKQGVEPKYLKYFLGKIGPVLALRGRGVAQSNLNLSILKKLEIPLPPLQIQKQIVERMDKIVEAQRLNDELIQKADELYRSLLHNELNAKFKNQNAKSQFKIQKLDEIAEVTSSKRIYQSEYIKNGIPFYRTKEIVELSQNNSISLELFISENRFDEIKEKFGIPKKGDILISAVGTIGISWIVPDDRKFYFKDGNLLWIKNLKGIDSHYLKIVLENFAKNISRMGAGGAYNALTIIKLKKVKILVPLLKTQKQIVAKLSAAQDYKKELLAQKSLFKELFDSVLYKSMNSEIN